MLDCYVENCIHVARTVAQKPYTFLPCVGKLPLSIPSISSISSTFLQLQERQTVHSTYRLLLVTVLYTALDGNLFSFIKSRVSARAP